METGNAMAGRRLRKNPKGLLSPLNCGGKGRIDFQVQETLNNELMRQAHL